MNVIFISGKAEHGKDTAATMAKEYLESKGKNVLLTHYADLLKWMCSNYFGWDGKKDLYGRSLLQRVGTDVIRAQKPTFWVDWVVNLLTLFPEEWDYVIIPDCRFPNEIEDAEAGLKEIASTKHFRVHRPNYESSLSPEQKKHISEIALDNLRYDALLSNTSLDDLNKQVRDAIDLISSEN